MNQARHQSPTRQFAASHDVRADLTNCDREPIHVPGSVQPYGVLCAFTEHDLSIVSLSLSVEAFTGQTAERLVGRPLSELLEPESFSRVGEALRASDLARHNPVRVRLAGKPDSPEGNGILHRQEEMTILEFDPHRGDELSYRDAFEHVRAATRRLKGARSIGEACQVVAEEVRRITGFTRVKLYHFHPDAHGEVLAEDQDGTMPSYLGLHYPPTDVPAPARELYLKNFVRIIPDIHYQPSPLLPDRDPATGKPIDLSHAVLRSVSPVHIEYLENMRVRASMSVSVVRDGKLWGLIACHDKEPRYLGYEGRQACELVAQALAWQLAVLEEMEGTRQNLQAQSLQVQLATAIGRAHDPEEALRQNGQALCDALRASGLALYSSESTLLIGRTPNEAQVGQIVDFLERNPKGGAVFNTDRLCALMPEAESFSSLASGVLAVPLSVSRRNLLLWFRPEIAQTVTWGGDPNKAATASANDERLHPRKSFEAWSELVRNRSQPWGNNETSTALQVRDLVVDAMMHKAEDLERSSAAVKRSAEMLETFVYIVSHDLSAPARQIATLSDLLKDAALEPEADDLQEVVQGIQGVSRRLQTLIGDLANFSKVGREAQPLEPVDLDEVVAEVRHDLKRFIDEAGARLQVQSLPSAVCDRAQLRHVFLNLLSNAIKFRKPDLPPLVRVYAARDEARLTSSMQGSTTESDRNRTIRIFVEDNGIGFDEKHREQIFEPFRRLHGAGHYDGSGVGLAICRRIVERHGGSIEATSVEGKGTKFSFTLPVRDAYPFNA